MTKIQQPDEFDYSERQKRLQAAIKELGEKFKTDADCMEAIIKAICLYQPPQCTECGSYDIRHTYGNRNAECGNCKKKLSLTAGTFFHNMRKPRAYLAAITLMENGVVYNPHQFHAYLEIAISSASKLFKKVKTVLESLMTADENVVKVGSAAFTEVICKRSKVTPSGQSPLAELEEIEKNQALVQPTAKQAVANLDSIQQKIYDHLSDEPISFDDLLELTNADVGPLSANLTFMSIDGLVTELSGNTFIRTKIVPSMPPQSPQIRDHIEAMIKTTKTIFGGFSRKYLQLYTAYDWCCLDRVRWSLDELMKSCCKFGYVRPKDIMDFISPLEIKVIVSP